MSEPNRTRHHSVFTHCFYWCLRWCPCERGARSVLWVLLQVSVQPHLWVSEMFFTHSQRPEQHLQTGSFVQKPKISSCTERSSSFRRRWNLQISHFSFNNINNDSMNSSLDSTGGLCWQLFNSFPLQFLIWPPDAKLTSSKVPLRPFENVIWCRTRYNSVIAGISGLF